MKSALLLPLLLVLAGCASQAVPPASSPTPSDSATPATPTPTVAVTLTIPACDALVPLSLIQEVFSDSSEFIAEVATEQAAGRFPIPEIASTIAEARMMRSCLWGLPNSDGAVLVTVAEVTPEQQAALSAALLSAGFLDGSVAPVSAYRLEQEGIVSLDAATHLFRGPIWVMADSSGLGTTNAVADAALAAVVAANP